MLRAVGNHIVVKPIEPETKTASGIIIPPTKKDVTGAASITKGEVLSIGDTVEVEVGIGDVVFFKPYGPEIYEHGGQEYMILQQQSIHCVVEE